MRNVKIIFPIAALLLAGCWSPRETRSGGTSANYGPGENVSTKPAVNKANLSNSNTNSNMNDRPPAAGFMANLPAGFKQPTDDVQRKILKEYGAVFLARGGATPPDRIVFRDETEVSAFQSSLQTSSEKIGNFNLTLQTAAMDGLRSAIAEAKQQNLTITPRGQDSAKRTYNETIELWKGRVDPALVHWQGKGKITAEQAAKIKAMPPFEQVSEVLKLEETGVFFAKDLSKSIMYSVAPPGTSQHLSMLALDVSEFSNAKVREILARHGWFQTVVSDMPHFTFLGVKEGELSGLGLKKTSAESQTFWVPDI